MTNRADPHLRARRPVIFDTDPGVDDAMALLFLTSSDDLELAGISTIFGNADVETTTRNARFLCGRFAIPAPVWRGAAGPLAGEPLVAPDWIHGRNGLGDIDVDLADAPEADAGPAHRRIIELIRARPGEITLIAVGPLTNLALALGEAPDIVGLVREVVVMGGAFEVRGNVSAVAEANIRNDPHAADRVFTAGWPITIVGLNVTTRCVMSNAFADRLAAEAGERGRFIREVSRGYAAAYAKYDGLDGCCLHDVAAVAQVIDPDLFTVRHGPVRVVTEGAAIGQTIQSPGQAGLDPVGSTAASSSAVCSAVDAEGLLLLFQETLGRRGCDGANVRHGARVPAAPPTRPRRG